MSPPRSDDELDALLARGRVSGAQRENILTQVLKHSAAQRVSWLRRSSFVAGGLLSAAALVLLVRGTAPKNDGFHAKGVQTEPGAHVAIACKDGAIAACPHGSKLLFVAGGLEAKLFLSAYAENALTSERVWFSPDEQGEPVSVALGREDAVLDQGVSLSPLPAGEYRVRVFLSHEPLSRALLLSAAPAVAFQSTSSLTVLQ